jgi:hypothetical protein
LSTAAERDAAPRIRRRHVVFFGGFDPKGASWYHGLYKRHASLQAKINDLPIEVGARQRDEAGRRYWLARAQPAGEEICESRIEVVSWDALVRRYWPRHGLRLLIDMAVAYARVIGNGIPQLIKVGRIAPRTLTAMLYPLVFFVFGILVCALIGTMAAWLGYLLSASMLLAVAMGAVLLWFAVVLMMRIERRLDTGLLVRIYAFVARYGVRGMPELDRIVADAGARIEALARDSRIDELLVVGYSVGSILATRAFGRALPALAGHEGQGPQLALLTLGNCIPLLGLFPQAGEYRAELAALASSPLIKWVDVSSPSDWGSFAMLNPIEVCEIEVARKDSGWPLMTSPRFHTLFEPATYRNMIGNKHQMHFQYLMSSQKPGRYDYFAITAGPLGLRERYAQAREARA